MRIAFTLNGQARTVEAERAGREVLILPIHAALPFEDAHRIGRIVGEFLGSEAAAES